jgi:hypothetical protein
VVAGVLRGLAVWRSFRGSGASAVGLAIALAAVAALAFVSAASATKYFDSTIGVPGNTVGLTFGNAPADVAVNEPSIADGNAAANGDLYIVDDANHRIQRLNSDGTFDLMWGGDVNAPAGGNDLEVCAVAADCKVGVASGGNGTAAGNGTLDNPQGVAVDQETGNVYVSDRDNRRIDVFTADGVFVRAFGQDVVASGPGDRPLVLVNEQQTVQLTAAFDIGCFCPKPITGGTFTLTFAGNTTAAIAYNASAIDVRQALEALANIAPGDVTVTGGPGPTNTWTVEFTGAYAGTNVAQMTGSGAGLAPPGSFGPPSVTVSTPVSGGPAPDYEICAAGADVCKAGIGFSHQAATNPGQYSAGTTVGGYRVDVSKPDGNPAAGKVYLANTGSRRVEVYNLDGSSPTNFGTAVANTFAVGEPRYVAVDNDEIVYGTIVPGNFGNLVRYDGAAQQFLDDLNIASLSPTATDQSGGWGVTKVGLDVDRLSGHLFFGGSRNAVAEIADPGTTPVLDDLHSATVPVSTDADVIPSSIAINPDTGELYVTAANSSGALQGRTVIFDNDGLGPIEIVPLPATNVGATAADVAATVNPAPNGPTGQPTSYRFELSKTGVDGSWTQITSDALVAPDGDTDVATPVQTHVTDLEPNTFYRVRVVATRANNTGTVVSGEQIFLTDPAPPTVSGLRVNQVRDTSADLRGRVNPNNQATSYRFNYAVVGGGAVQQTPVQSVGSGGEPVPVSAQIEGLVPNTTYSYTLEATNATGTTTSSTATFTTLSEVAPDADCANQQFRTGPSAALPDCRAYEMVSPIDKNGGDIATAEEQVGEGSRLASGLHQASINGGKITYSSASAFADAVGGHWSNQYIASRSSHGWSTEAISSRRGRSVFEPQITLNAEWDYAFYTFFQGFTPDLSSAWVRDDNVDPLAPGALQGYVNLYRRDNTSDTYQPLTNEGPYGSNALKSLTRATQTGLGGLRFAGASEDLRHQVFVATAPLTPDARLIASAGTGVNQIYDFIDGELHLVSVLPNGTTPVGHSFPGTVSNGRLASRTHEQMLTNAVSDDGSRIFWTATAAGFTLAGPGTLYVRLNSGEQPSLVSGGQCTEPEKACTVEIATGAQYWGAAADGSKVLYSTGNHPNWTLFMYDVATKTSTQIATQSAGVAATADDLSRIYFVSGEALAPGAIAGQSNLYAYQVGTYDFIAQVTSTDISGVSQLLGGAGARTPSLTGMAHGLSQPMPINNQTRATADGRHFAFMSNSRELSESVAGYDNRDVVTGDPTFEVYRYDSDAGDLSCVSCKPSGERPEGALPRVPYSPTDLTFTHPDPPPNPNFRMAALIPSWEHDHYASRVLSSDGSRLFFHSRDRLLPGDVNGDVQDVYQWTAEGSHDCDSSDGSYSAQNDGCLSLISTGEDDANYVFVDADPTGDEVFVSTDESLDPRDPGLRDIYVAKVGGGFPAPAAPAEPCGVQEGQCQGGGFAPVSGDTTTSSPSGSEDASPGARKTLALFSLSSKARRRASRTGRLSIAVRTSSPGKVSLTVKAKIGKRARRVGGASKRVATAGKVRLKVRLSSAARKRLRAGRKLRLTVQVRQAGARARTTSILLPGVKS